MKVLLRKTNNSHYYVADNQWTADSRYARDFGEIEQAIQVHREEKLAGVEVVLSYDDPLCDLVLPLRVTGMSALGPVTIFASSNMSDWQGIFTNPPTIGPLEFWDSPASNGTLRFYRAGEFRP